MHFKKKVKDSSFVPQRQKALMSTSIKRMITLVIVSCFLRISCNIEKFSDACSHVICYFVTCQELATLCYILPIRPRKIQG